MITSEERAHRALEARARRAARKAGYLALKCRKHRGSIDNFGDFQIVDPYLSGVVAGSRFDLSAQDVLDWLEAD